MKLIFPQIYVIETVAIKRYFAIKQSVVLKALPVPVKLMTLYWINWHTQVTELIILTMRPLPATSFGEEGLPHKCVYEGTWRNFK